MTLIFHLITKGKSSSWNVKPRTFCSCDCCCLLQGVWETTRFPVREHFTNWTRTVHFTMNNRFHGGLVFSPSRPNRFVDPSNGASAAPTADRTMFNWAAYRWTGCRRGAEGLLGGGRRTSHSVNINTNPVAVRLWSVTLLPISLSCLF